MRLNAATCDCFDPRDTESRRESLNQISRQFRCSKAPTFNIREKHRRLDLLGRNLFPDADMSEELRQRGNIWLPKDPDHRSINRFPQSPCLVSRDALLNG